MKSREEQKLKVVVVLSHYCLSGVTTNTIDLCEGLKELGHDVTLIIGKPELDNQIIKQQYLLNKGVRVINVPVIGKGLRSKIIAFLSIIKLLMTLKYDIIHMESVYLTFIPWLLGKKFTLTWHFNGIPKTVYSKKANHLIAISKETKDDAVNHHGYKSEDISIVLHGVNKRFAELATLDERTAIKQRLDLPQDKILIGIVGSIEPRKGHHFLLEAVSKLSLDRAEMIHVVFLGCYKGEHSEEWIHGLIAGYKLQEKVTIIPFQDPKPIYQVLDIFCLPSVREGFPLVAIEAKLAGCCVIRSNVDGVDEQIIDGVTGYIFQTENPEDLMKKLESLIDNPERMKQVGMAGREDALQRFTLDVMAENTVKVYREIIG